MDHQEYLKRVRSYIKTPTKEIESQLNEFCGLCSYISGQYDEDESFEQLDKHLAEFEKGKPEGHRVFYMALPPSVFIPVSEHLKRCCYPKRGIARVIVSLISFHSVFSTHTVAGRETIRERSCKLARVAKGFGARLERRGNLPYRPLSR